MPSSPLSRIRCRKTRCCRTICSKACMRASHSSRTSSSSTSIRRACSRTRGVSTGGFAATGRSCCGSSRSFRRATASSGTRSRSLSRWKILDNLRRSLVAPMLLALLVAGWTILPGAHWFWTTAVLAVMASQLLPLVAQMVVGPPTAQSFPVFWRNLRADTAIALAQVALGVTFLAYHAWDTAHAIVLTLVRLTITKRRLLEWETAAAAAARAAGIGGGRALLRFAADMMASPIIAVVVALVVSITHRDALPSTVPFLVALGGCTGRRVLAELAGGAARTPARRSRAVAATEDGPKDVAIFRNVRHRGRCMAAARQLPGRHPAATGQAYISDQHRHDDPVDAGRTRSRLPDDRDADSPDR